MSDDGRLSPEELEELLSAPGPAGDGDAPPAGTGAGAPALSAPETISGGTGPPRWSTGLATRFRRRPVAVALVALVALIGGAAATYARTRPPPLATDLAAIAWFVPQPSNLQGVLVRDGVAHARLRLQLPAGEPAVTVTGFTAQGMGSAAVRQQGADVTVTGPVDCASAGDLFTPPALPVLHLSRTDEWGRTVRADLPVSADGGSADVPASQVADALLQQCLGQVADALQLIRLTPGTAPGGRSVLHLVVANPTGHDLRLFGALARSGPAARIGSSESEPAGTSASGQVLPARSQTQVTLPVRRDDCGRQQLTGAVAWFPDPGPGRRTGDFALGVVPPGPWIDTGFDTWTALPPGPRMSAAVDAALAAPCRGAPRLSYAFLATAGGRGEGGFASATVRISASRGTVSLVSSSVHPYLRPLTLYPTNVTEPGAHRQVIVQVDAMDCQQDYAHGPPPTLELTARADGRTFPYLLTLGDRAALEALSASCGQLPRLQLARQFGWVV